MPVSCRLYGKECVPVFVLAAGRKYYMIDQVSYFFIFFGGFMSWTMSLGLLLEKRRGVSYRLFGGFMFCLGALQILDGLFVMEQSELLSSLVFLDIPLLSWICPFFLLAFRSVNNDLFVLKPVALLHFLPGTVMLVLTLPLFFMEPGESMRFIVRSPDVTDGEPLFRLYSGLFFMVNLIVIGYLSYFVRECFAVIDIRLVKKKRVSPYLILVLGIMFPFVAIFFGTLLTISFLGCWEHLYLKVLQFLTAFSFLITLTFFIMEKRGINFFRILQTQLLRRQYEILNSSNLNVPLVISRIESLMKDDEIYRDENLSVTGMAEELSVKPYQLSRIINDNYNKNFNFFINEYRVNEAKRLFMEDVDRTIISVAYEVGFNSTTVFYEWFKRITGVSPKSFRRNIKGKN